MRDLKFRAYDSRLKKWIVEDFYILGEFNLFGGFDDWICNNEFVELGFLERYNDIIIQQFTGLNDKTGRAIYEGDLVKIKSNSGGTWAGYLKGEIVYDNEDSSFKLKNQYGLSHPWIKQNQPIITILGNIFDNPELLESKSL